MELKDMVLSTLAEIESTQQIPTQVQNEEIKNSNEVNCEIKTSVHSLNEEEIFLKNVKQRVLVLFEGLQSPKNDNIQIKLDITLNFLEFLLSCIEQRLDKIDK